MIKLRTTKAIISGILLLFVSGITYAAGPIMVESHHTIEGARITVKANDENQSGTVIVDIPECLTCPPSTFNYDQNTVLQNQFGAQRPIEELKTWSGNRAMFHALKSSLHIEYIKILP